MQIGERTISRRPGHLGRHSCEPASRADTSKSVSGYHRGWRRRRDIIGACESIGIRVTLKQCIRYLLQGRRKSSLHRSPAFRKPRWTTPSPLPPHQYGPLPSASFRYRPHQFQLKPGLYISLQFLLGSGHAQEKMEGDEPGDCLGPSKPYYP